MRRKHYRSYVLLSFLLFGCIHLPPTLVKPFRILTIRIASPAWKKLGSKASKQEEKIKKLEGKADFLKRENALLHSQLNLQGDQKTPCYARVIYREPTSWSSMLWVNVGENVPHVSVNSPVLSGKHLIGIVEEVGKKQSRVRLLTDSALAVSVRVARGNPQKQEMLQLINTLLLELSAAKDSKQELTQKLTEFKSELLKDIGEKYLAKGELLGTSSPLWRSRSPVLKGVGFNYDFADEKGPALELRSGKPYSALLDGLETILIEKGDLLVTTGLDGVFPPDIPVAIVTKVDPLKEGAVSYSIEAKLCASSIEELSSVMILPALPICEKRSH